MQAPVRKKSSSWKTECAPGGTCTITTLLTNHTLHPHYRHHIQREGMTVDLGPLRTKNGTGAVKVPGRESHGELISVKDAGSPAHESWPSRGSPGGGSAGIPAGLKAPGLLRELSQLVHHLLKARVGAALQHALGVLLPARLPAIHLHAVSPMSGSAPPCGGMHAV